MFCNKMHFNAAADEALDAIFLDKVIKQRRAKSLCLRKKPPVMLLRPVLPFFAGHGFACNFFCRRIFCNRFFGG
jgi:hypothetical protein